MPEASVLPWKLKSCKPRCIDCCWELETVDFWDRARFIEPIFFIPFLSPFQYKPCLPIEYYLHIRMMPQSSYNDPIRCEQLIFCDIKMPTKKALANEYLEIFTLAVSWIQTRRSFRSNDWFNKWNCNFPLEFCITKCTSPYLDHNDSNS